MLVRINGRQKNKSLINAMTKQMATCLHAAKEVDF